MGREIRAGVTWVPPPPPPLPISVRKCFSWLHVWNLWPENLPESETKPARWPFFFGRASRILLHPYADMAPPTSARTDPAPSVLRPGNCPKLAHILFGKIPALCNPPSPLTGTRCEKEIAFHSEEPQSTFDKILLKIPAIWDDKNWETEAWRSMDFSPRKAATGWIPRARARARTQAHARGIHAQC